MSAAWCWSAQDGKLVYARRPASPTAKPDVQMREDAIFRLASVTKPMVATAALAMVERGLLGLDDPVTDYLPYFTPQAGGWTRRRLSPSGTCSAIRPGSPTNDAADDCARAFRATHSARREPEAAGRRCRLAFAPGTGWEYGMSLDVARRGDRGDQPVDGGRCGGALRHRTARHDGRDVRGHRSIAAGGTLCRRRAAQAHGRVRRWCRSWTAGRRSSMPGRIFEHDSPAVGRGRHGRDGGRRAEAAGGVSAGDRRCSSQRRSSRRSRTRSARLPRRARDGGKRFGLIGALVDDPAAAKTPCPHRHGRTGAAPGATTGSSTAATG